MGKMAQEVNMNKNQLALVEATPNLRRLKRFFNLSFLDLFVFVIFLTHDPDGPTSCTHTCTSCGGEAQREASAQHDTRLGPCLAPYLQR